MQHKKCLCDVKYIVVSDVVSAPHLWCPFIRYSPVMLKRCLLRVGHEMSCSMPGVGHGMSRRMPGIGRKMSCLILFFMDSKV